MAEAIADRLAEAFAEVLHGVTRRELWAYAPDESLSPEDMLRVKYQGARPEPSQTLPELSTAPTLTSCLRPADGSTHWRLHVRTAGAGCMADDVCTDSI